MKFYLFNSFFIINLNMSGCKYKFLIIISVLSMLNLANGIPMLKKNSTINRRDGKFVEIKLPAHKTSRDDLILWIKKAMESMASRVDITLEPTDDTNPKFILNNDNKIDKFDKNIIFNGNNNPWFSHVNELYPQLINTNSYLPLVFGEPGIKYENIKPINYLFDKKNNDAIIEQSKINLTNADDKKITNESTKVLTASKYDNSIPFEAFITISREPIVNQEQQALSSKVENLKKPIEDNINQKITIINNSNKQQKANDEDNSKKRQISTIGELLNQLGIFRRPSGNNKTPEASTLTSIFSRPTKKKIRGTTSRPFSLEFDDVSFIDNSCYDSDEVINIL